MSLPLAVALCSVTAVLVWLYMRQSPANVQQKKRGTRAEDHSSPYLGERRARTGVVIYPTDADPLRAEEVEGYALTPVQCACACHHGLCTACGHAHRVRDRAR